MLTKNKIMQIKRKDGLEFCFEMVGYNDEDSGIIIDNRDLNNSLIELIKKGVKNLNFKKRIFFFVQNIEINDSTLNIKGFITDGMIRLYDYDGLSFYENADVKNPIVISGNFFIDGVNEIQANEELLLLLLNSGVLISTDEDLKKYGILPRFRLLTKDKQGKRLVKYYGKSSFN